MTIYVRSEDRLRLYDLHRTIQEFEDVAQRDENWSSWELWHTLHDHVMDELETVIGMQKWSPEDRQELEASCKKEAMEQGMILRTD